MNKALKSSLVFIALNGVFAFAGPEKPENLVIRLTQPAQPAAPATKTKDASKAPPAAAAPVGNIKPIDKTLWAEACKMMGTTLTVGSGPWGFGAFSGYSCYAEQELISGNSSNSPWVLTAIEDLQGFHIRLEYEIKGKVPLEIYKIDLPSSDKPYGYFRDLDLADLTAYAILDAMPAMTYISATEKTGTSATVVGRKSRENAKFLVPNPPDNMSVMDFEFDSKKSRFKEIPIGTMNFLGYRIPGKQEQSKTLGREVVTPLWGVDAKLEAAIAKGPLWAHNIAGPGTKKTELNKSVENAYRFLALGVAPTDPNLLTGVGSDVTDVNFRDKFMRGAVALRYGLSLIRTPPLLKKTKLFGIVSEIRPGGIGGFRLFYDTVPVVKEKVDIDGVGESTEFSWNRVAIGWSFGFNIQRFTKNIFDYVDITPKASIWSISSALKVSEDSGSGEISAFELKRDPSIGWELGLEKTLHRVLFRGFYGADFLGLFSKLEKKTSVKIHRFGLDTWVAGPQFSLKSYMRTSFLAFFWYENVSFQKKGTTEEGISGIDLRFAYLGLGTGVQW